MAFTFDCSASLRSLDQSAKKVAECICTEETRAIRVLNLSPAVRESLLTDPEAHYVTEAQELALKRIDEKEQRESIEWSTRLGSIRESRQTLRSKISRKSLMSATSSIEDTSFVVKSEGLLNEASRVGS